jgi:hypothetical protein
MARPCQSRFPGRQHAGSCPAPDASRRQALRCLLPRCKLRQTTQSSEEDSRLVFAMPWRYFPAASPLSHQNNPPALIQPIQSGLLTRTFWQSNKGWLWRGMGCCARGYARMLSCTGTIPTLPAAARGAALLGRTRASGSGARTLARKTSLVDVSCDCDP